METKKRNKLSATQILVLGMILIILIGSILLKLPISNREGKNIKYIDSLFVSTSCVCVTGLTTVVPIEQFTVFGQVVMMLLIEVGGLGFMSFIGMILLIMKKKINLSDGIVLKESLNQNSTTGLTTLIPKIFVFTISFELIGAILLSISFIPTYGICKGIYYSIFHSISAFCNAGFDIIGDNSLIPYQHDFIVNITIMLLIIIGGLGFTVWDDLFNAIRSKCSIPRMWKKLTTHTKLVLVTTIILLISGTLITFIFEKNNFEIMGNDYGGQKLMKSAFYSTTLRTAGFTTLNTKELTSTTKFLSMLFMFIGGAPGSTAGGIKTVTFAIIILMVVSFIKDEERTVVFNRKIEFQTVKRAVAVTTMSVCIVAVSIVLLTTTEPNADFVDVTYEVFSAYGTVGITLGLTPLLSGLGKFIVMLLMFAGRLGPITLSFALFYRHKRKIKNIIRYPKCDLLVG